MNGDFLLIASVVLSALNSAMLIHLCFRKPEEQLELPVKKAQPMPIRIVVDETERNEVKKLDAIARRTLKQNGIE